MRPTPSTRAAARCSASRWSQCRSLLGAAALCALVLLPAVLRADARHADAQRADAQRAEVLYDEALIAFRRGDMVQAEARARRAIAAYQASGQAGVAVGEMQHVAGRALLLLSQQSHGSLRREQAKRALHDLTQSERSAPSLGHLDRTLSPGQDRERNHALLRCQRIIEGERLLLLRRSGPGQILLPQGQRCGAGCEQIEVEHPLDSRLVLVAQPDPDALFEGWQGACSGTGPCELTLTSDLQVRARFRGRPLLSLDLVGGPGLITSTPSGLRCQEPTCSARFPEGSSVQLVATPAGGASFSGWSGACQGAGPCALVLRQPTQVTARFRPLSRQPWLWSTLGAAVALGVSTGLLLHYHPWDPNPEVIRDVPPL